MEEQNQIELSEVSENFEVTDLLNESETTDDEGFGYSELKEMLVAFLFVSMKPISVSELSDLSKVDEVEVSNALERISEELGEAGLGIELKVIGESYQLRTKPALSKVLQRMITPKMKRLSKAAAETLAVVAYKQPVPRAEIEAIRGVDALPTLKTLLDGRLIRIVGREDTAGSPALYGTTDFLLERFGLKDLSHLPTVREVRELEDEASESDSGDDQSEFDLDSAENDIDEGFDETSSDETTNGHDEETNTQNENDTKNEESYDLN